jgi:hypothetical protein
MVIDLHPSLLPKWLYIIVVGLWKTYKAYKTPFPNEESHKKKLKLKKKERKKDR